MFEFKLPDVGEGLTEAEIVSWKVKAGDVVEINDVIVEIETAKSLVELPSPYAGTVLSLLVAEGETVPVGTSIIAIGAEGEAGGSAPAAPAAPAAVGEIDLSNPAASGGGEGESLVGRAPAERGAQRRPRRKLVEAAGEHVARAGVHDTFNAGAPPQTERVERIVAAVATQAADQRASQGAPLAPVEPAGATGSTSAGAAVRALAKPPVRKLAKDLGVDLASLTPTGPNGTVSRADVEQAAGTAAAPTLTAVPDAPAGGAVGAAAGGAVGVRDGVRETREPIKGVRKAMAEAMVGSAFTSPHVTEWITLDVTRTMEFVERLRGHRDFREVKVSPLLVLARAAMAAMRRTPMINSWWDGAAGEVAVRHYVNLGIAAATPRGLVVPNIKDADQLSLVELAAALGQLTETARSGRTQPAEMSGGTFTITNVGVFGVDGGTPIINPGESAILCFGAIKKQPWVVTDADGNDTLAIRQVTTLSLSFDHRHIDGESGSRFLADVASVLEDPANALLL
ncbi:dihydrolipoamide acetyltransferase family protein [Nocardioides dubius]|uniref:Dihydrolipoamide acetyltransferase component of pyruvate dehydrogenase complex n=1 Tax=Nocardioides dubius TaxID=317019 RepID=A0ABP4ENI5_9ACTN